MKTFLLSFLLFTAGWAHAQLNTITVTPASAAPGTPRTITIDTVQAVGCEARQARVVDTEVQWQRTLVVHLVGGNTGIFCDALTNYRYVTTYTPSSEGDLKVMAVLAVTPFPGATALLAESTMVTRAPASARSRHDLTGMWYDPATNGSGLTFIHAAARNDAVFGTWFLYDAQGLPRWFTIQNVNWKSGGLEAEGTLFNSSSAINICPLTVIGCPVAAALTAPLGRARIVMHSATQARIEALTPDGSVVFASNVIRPAI
ncbi:MAG: hypothetical protein JNK75_15255 [Betaproteobacteria bacterium]|nr:hypothetical protein [Betaproteobacteria bacterium]